VTYPTSALFEEVGYVAWHFHWPLAEILELDHETRHRMVEVIGGLVGRTGEE